MSALDARSRPRPDLARGGGRPAPTGLLAVFDLANVGSVLHLLTEDLARVEDGGFRLLGRASGAELRGCSLTAEELEASARTPMGRAGQR